MQKIQLIQGSKEWLDYRLNGVGGSEVAAIAGINGAFNKRSDVLANKNGQVKEISDFQRKLFRDGHEWEAVVRATSFETFIPDVVARDDNPRLFASLDGIDYDKKTILEIKSVLNKPKFVEYTDKPPAHYIAQVQWQLFVTGYECAFLAFVHDGMVNVTIVRPDIDLQNRLHACAIEFLQELDAIRNGSAPAPVQTLSTHEMSRIAYLKKTREEMKIQIDMIEEEISGIAEKLMSETKATKLESDEITISYLERVGTIDYKKIPEVQKLHDSYLQSFRGKGSKSIQVKLKK